MLYTSMRLKNCCIKKLQMSNIRGSILPHCGRIKILDAHRTAGDACLDCCC